MVKKTVKQTISPSTQVSRMRLLLQKKRSIFLLAIVLLLVSCTGSSKSDDTSQIWQNWTYDGAYTLTVDPARALLDTPVSIRASGLKAQQPVIIRASMQMQNQILESYAAFAADSSGAVDVSQMAPLAGSYTGKDGMGLFWSMKKVKTSAEQAQAGTGRGPQPQKLTFTLEARDQVLARQEIERLFYDEAQVERREVSQEGLVATFFLPKQPGPHAGIIWLGGSEGGLSEAFPALLASHGYATLALAYFKAGSLPSELVLIPLEALKQGIDWFRAQPEVDKNQIALLGGSKGAELALLLAATYPEDIQSVVAYKPSSVVWMGIPANQADTLRGPKSSWSYNQQPLPFVNGVFTGEMLKLIAGRPAAMVGTYEGGLKDAKAVDAARIPVEKIRGPVLLFSGADDKLWPSSQMSEQVMDELDEANFPYRHEHWSYQNAGHGLGLPNTYTTYINQGTLLLGGTPQGTATANVDAWAKTLEFLSSAFPAPTAQEKKP